MILLPAEVRAGLQGEAEAAYPDECCGLLVGRRLNPRMIAVSRAVASRNVAEGGARDRFEVDPAVRFALMRELAGTAAVVVGHYHSHPEHPAEPSATDRAMAFEPDLVWLIIAVGTSQPGAPARAGSVRAFRIAAGGAVVELPIVGVEAPATK